MERASNESGVNQTTGWWYEALLYQAYTNYKAGAGAPTGMTFGAGGPTPAIGAPNTLGIPATVLISNYPTVTVTFSNGSYAQFSQWLKTQTSMSVKLFGLFTVGQASVGTYTASAQQGASDASFTLTLTPPPSAGVTVDLRRRLRGRPVRLHRAVRPVRPRLRRAAPRGGAHLRLAAGLRDLNFELITTSTVVSPGACFQATFITTQGSFSVRTTGAGSATLGNRTGAYSSPSTIYVKVEKLTGGADCSTR